MSRNFGLSRDFAAAGRIALHHAFARREISGKSEKDLGQRWGQFVAFARENGITKMEQVTRDDVISYGNALAERVREEDLAASSAQNMLSAVNTVLQFVPNTKWETVSPTKDCQIPSRSTVRSEPPIERTAYDVARKDLQDRGLTRQEAVVALCREFGLRSKEASLLDASGALRKALTGGDLRVTAGTKGGRPRTVPVRTEQQVNALRYAASVQGDAKSLVPAESTMKAWRDGGLRTAREAVQSAGGSGLHDLRAAYACERYRELTGFDAPCIVGERLASKEEDKAARLEIAKELGHGRVDVLAAYVGSAK